MPTLAERYRGPADLPQRIPVFPLRGAILLPRATLPLNVFEPRYLADARRRDVAARACWASCSRPPARRNRRPASPPLCAGSAASAASRPIRSWTTGACHHADRHRPLHAGRTRSTIAKPYRICTVGYDRFLADFVAGAGEDDVDRQALLARAQDLPGGAPAQRADWSAVSKSSNETLVNSLAIAAPYGPEEKQALLEAPTLKARAETLVALAEMELAAGAGGSGSTLQ